MWWWAGESNISPSAVIVPKLALMLIIENASLLTASIWSAAPCEKLDSRLAEKKTAAPQPVSTKSVMPSSSAAAALRLMRATTMVLGGGATWIGTKIW